MKNQFSNCVTKKKKKKERKQKTEYIKNGKQKSIDETQQREM